MKKPKVNQPTKYATRKAPARTRQPTKAKAKATAPAQTPRAPGPNNQFAGTDLARRQNPQNVGRNRIFKQREKKAAPAQPQEFFRRIVVGNDGTYYTATFNRQGQLVLPQGSPYSINSLGGQFEFGGYSTDANAVFAPAARLNRAAAIRRNRSSST